MKTNNFLAHRTHEVEWSGIRVMLALTEEIPDVVNLGIGQPDFDTPTHIRDAAKQALDDGYTRYPPAKGFTDLREVIAQKLKSQNNILADPDTEIYVAVGAMQVIFNTCLHVLNPGDEVIVVDPGYDYYSQIRLFGGVPVPVRAHESNRFKVDPADVNNAITSKTKLMIVNTPSNPTGAVLDEAILRSLADLAITHDIWVLSDEPYEHILFDGTRHISIGAFDGMAERTVSAFTLSKSYAMTGWRVGYTAAPKAIIDEMEKLMEHMVSGVTAVAQRAALKALNASQKCVREMVHIYDQRRCFIHEGLNAIDGIKCLKPESTFYAFANISSTGLSSWEFAKYLIQEHRVAVVPGSIFGKGGEGHVRISFAADMDQLQEGVDRITRGVAALRR